MTETFNYIVAKPWYPEEEDSELCIYSYGGEIQQNGTIGSAKNFLQYVQRNSTHEDAHLYAIYKIKIDKIE